MTTCNVPQVSGKGTCYPRVHVLLDIVEVLSQAESISNFKSLYQQCVESEKNVNRTVMLSYGNAAITNRRKNCLNH